MSFPRQRVGGAPGVLATGAAAKRKKFNSILYERINGYGVLTETENVIFLRKLRSSYGILTDERNSHVLLQRTTEIRQRRNVYVPLETTHEGKQPKMLGCQQWSGEPEAERGSRCRKSKVLGNLVGRQCFVLNVVAFTVNATTLRTLYVGKSCRLSLSNSAMHVHIFYVLFIVQHSKQRLASIRGRCSVETTGHTVLSLASKYQNVSLRSRPQRHGVQQSRRPPGGCLFPLRGLPVPPEDHARSAPCPDALPALEL